MGGEKASGHITVDQLAHAPSDILCVRKQTQTGEATGPRSLNTWTPGEGAGKQGQGLPDWTCVQGLDGPF